MKNENDEEINPEGGNKKKDQSRHPYSKNEEKNPRRNQKCKETKDRKTRSTLKCHDRTQGAFTLHMSNDC